MLSVHRHKIPSAQRNIEVCRRTFSDIQDCVISNFRVVDSEAFENEDSVGTLESCYNACYDDCKAITYIASGEKCWLSLKEWGEDVVKEEGVVAVFKACMTEQASALCKCFIFFSFSLIFQAMRCTSLSVPTF